MGIRPAREADVPAIVALSEEKRTQYERYQPHFWRKAPDSATKQAPFLAQQLTRENVIALVHEQGDVIDGFVIAVLVKSPPVYEAGITCAIDDFCVTGHDWMGTGRQLLDEALARAREREAAQVVVVCGHLDQPKREMLAAAGLSIASEWWTQPI